MVEKRLIAVPPQLFTADGAANGVVTVANTRLFKVKQSIILDATGIGPSTGLEIKRIPNGTQLEIGPIAGNIFARSNLTAYTLLLGANIYANEQSRPSIPVEEIDRAVYEEEPTVALRTILVDSLGNKIDDGNPLPVSVDTTVNIGDVRITANDNDPNPGNVHSSVRISDGTDDLEVNSDGSINVVVGPGPGATAKSFYSEVSSVANSVLTTVLTYTVPALTTATLTSVDVSGTNIAEFTVEVNASVVDKKRTYFSGPLNEVFGFDGNILLATGDVVTVRVIHLRPNVGDFNARVAVIEHI